MTYQFQILTPLGKFFSGEVIHARIPAEDGFVGVLARHAPYLTSSPGGALEVRLPSGETQTFHVGSGFFRVLKNDGFFLTHSAK